MIFAVCVHSLECWLLPLFYTDNKRKKITGGIDAMNVALKRANAEPLSNSIGEKSVRAFESAARGYEKRKTLRQASTHSASLRIFVEALDTLFTHDARA